MLTDVILNLLRKFDWFPRESKRLKTLHHWVIALGIFLGFLFGARTAGLLQFIPKLPTSTYSEKTSVSDSVPHFARRSGFSLFRSALNAEVKDQMCAVATLRHHQQWTRVRHLVSVVDLP